MIPTCASHAQYCSAIPFEQSICLLSPSAVPAPAAILSEIFRLALSTIASDQCSFSRFVDVASLILCHGYLIEFLWLPSQQRQREANLSSFQQEPPQDLCS